MTHKSNRKKPAPINQDRSILIPSFSSSGDNHKTTNQGDFWSQHVYEKDGGGGESEKKNVFAETEKAKLQVELRLEQKKLKYTTYECFFLLS